MHTFAHDPGDPNAARYATELESALLARALADTGGLPDERARALLRDWIAGVFNAHAAAIPGDLGTGTLDWRPDRDGFLLVWTMAGGLVAPLARLYPQPDGTWAAMVVAGVRDTPEAAMLAAEWAVARLTSP